MKPRTRKILYVAIFSVLATGFLYNFFYLDKIRARPSCEEGNFYQCAEKLSQLRSEPASSFDFGDIENTCQASNQGFCLEAVRAILKVRDRDLEIAKLKAHLPCGIQVPLSILGEACQSEPEAEAKAKTETEAGAEASAESGAAPDSNETLTNLVREKIEGACQPSESYDASCESAILFVKENAEFSSHLDTLLSRACVAGVISACQQAFNKSLELDQPEQAAKEFTRSFQLQKIEPMGDLKDCPVDERFASENKNLIKAFDKELAKSSPDMKTLSELAGAAFALNCRSSESLLRLAIVHSMENNFDSAVSLLKKIPNGKKHYADNKGFRNLQENCKQETSRRDEMCRFYLKTKLDYLEPKELQALLKSKVDKIKKAIVAKDVKKFASFLDSKQGFHFINEESGNKPVSKRYKLADIQKKSAVQKEIRKYLEKASEYLKKGKSQYKDQVASKDRRVHVMFKILEGRHAGNFRSFGLSFKKVKKDFVLTGISYESDSNP